MGSRSSKASGASHSRLLRLLANSEPTETLIVWQEPGSGVDMALSFQEAEGCALIWFVCPVGEKSCWLDDR